MPATTLLPDSSVLRLEVIVAEAQVITVILMSVQPDSPCPTCGQRSSSVHSHYTRTVADLPWADIPVQLKLRVRKFFCHHAACQRVIFTERLPTVVAAWARRSKRLAEHERQLGLAFGGQAASRVGQRLGLPASPDTALRLVRRAPSPTVPTPRVLGVDDWAWRKGKRYGTILVDLETRTPVDLLPDRTADALEQWLKQHPGVEIISRDRSGAYADGATRGAPEAIQVADRFHLLSNLRDALEGVVTRQQERIHTATEPSSGDDKGQDPSQAGDYEPERKGISPAGEPTRRQAETRRETVRAQQQRLANRARRLARYEQVMSLHRQGVSQKAIASRLGLSRRTIQRWLRTGHFPEHAPRRTRTTRLAPYESYLRERWDQGCHNGAQLYREIGHQGYTGSRTLVADWVIRQRRGEQADLLSNSVDATDPGADTPRVRSPRQIAWLLLQPPPAVDTDAQTFLDRLLKASPAIALACDLAQQFHQMVKSRHPESLDPWLEAVTDSKLPDLQRFAAGLRRDYSAVRAGLSLRWSNGPVEGHINRLKFIKRQGYGRAGFELLRRRILAA